MRKKIWAFILATLCLLSILVTASAENGTTLTLEDLQGKWVHTHKEAGIALTERFYFSIDGTFVYRELHNGKIAGSAGGDFTVDGNSIVIHKTFGDYTLHDLSWNASDDKDALVMLESSDIFYHEESVSGELFADIAPEGVEIVAYEPLYLIPLKGLGVRKLITQEGMALVLIMSVMDYGVNHGLDGVSFDVSSDAYVGVFRNRFASMYRMSKGKYEGEYICVLYDLENEKVAYYQTGLTDGRDAKLMLKDALPNQDCNRIDNDDLSKVINSLIGMFS